MFHEFFWILKLRFSWYEFWFEESSLLIILYASKYYASVPGRNPIPCRHGATSPVLTPCHLRKAKQWKSMMGIWGKGVWEVLWDENGGSCSGRRYRGGTVVSESFASSWTEGTNRELPRLAASPGSSMYSWEWDLWRENLRLIGLASNVFHLPLEAQIHEDHDLGVINMYMEIRGYDTDLAEDWQRICGGHIIEYWSGW